MTGTQSTPLQAVAWFGPRASTLRPTEFSTRRESTVFQVSGTEIVVCHALFLQQTSCFCWHNPIRCRERNSLLPNRDSRSKVDKGGTGFVARTESAAIGEVFHESITRSSATRVPFPALHEDLFQVRSASAPVSRRAARLLPAALDGEIIR